MLGTLIKKNEAARGATLFLCQDDTVKYLFMRMPPYSTATFVRWKAFGTKRSYLWYMKETAFHPLIMTGAPKIRHFLWSSSLQCEHLIGKLLGIMSLSIFCNVSQLLIYSAPFILLVERSTAVATFQRQNIFLPL